MNLLQSQDALKGENVAMLRARKSGQIPPTPDAPMWLVDAVLADKIDSLKKAELAQGAAQGALPSITEQISQKAEGLMALQAKTQQAQQQMAQQMAQAPQPAPEGVPQPEPQPQPEPPMMAHGGLARLPVDSRMFDYREGGIIGFAEPEGAVPASERWQDMVKRPNESGEDFARRVALARQASYQSQMAPATEDQVLAKRRAALEAERAKNMAQVDKVDSMEFPSRPNMQNDPRYGLANIASPEPVVAPRPVPAAPRPRPPAQTPAVTSNATATPLPAAAPGLSSVAPPSGLQTALLEALKVRPDRTIADAKADREAATPALLNEPAGLAQLARLKQQQEQYTKSQEDRPYERLMAVLGAGGRGGIGSMGAGYLGAMQGERAADAAQAKYQNEVNNAVDAMRRGEATTTQTALLDDLKNSQTTQAENARNRLTTLGSARGNELTAETAAAQNASQERIGAARDAASINVAKIQAAAQRFSAEGRLDSNDAKLALTAARAQMDNVQKEILELSKNPFLAANQARIAELRPQLDTLRRSIATLEGGGSTMPPSPGAKAPALKYNPATGKIE
jgi:hypothetical protein